MMSNEMRRMVNTLMETSRQLVDAQNELMARAEAMSAAHEHIKRLQERVESLEEERDGLAQDRSVAMVEIAALEHRCARYEKTINTLAKDKGLTVSEGFEVIVATLSKDVLTQRIADLEVELDAADRARDAAHALVTEREDTIEKLRWECDKALDDLEDARLSLAKALGERDASRALLDALTKAKEQQNEWGMEMRKQRDEARDELLSARSDLEDARNELSQLGSALARLLEFAR